MKTPSVSSKEIHFRNTYQFVSSVFDANGGQRKVTPYVKKFTLFPGERNKGRGRGDEPTQDKGFRN